jgi:hypothetical protein
MSKAKGGYFPSKQTIMINDHLGQSEADAVLTHELSHALAHLSGYIPDDPTEAQRVYAEHLAHGAAGIVCDHLGLDYAEEATTLPEYPNYLPWDLLSIAEQQVARKIAECIIDILDGLPAAFGVAEWAYARASAIQSLTLDPHVGGA